MVEEDQSELEVEGEGSSGPHGNPNTQGRDPQSRGVAPADV